MERIEVIKGLEIERECVSRDCDRDCGKCDLVQDREWLLSVYDGAIELLKEQEPIAPSLLVSKGPGEVCSRRYLCGKCKKPIDYKDMFCKRCGQAVKWDATNAIRTPTARLEKREGAGR